MRGLLAGELIKVRTTRTAIGFGLAAVLLTLATVLISILSGTPTDVEGKRGAIAFGGIAFVLLIYGAVGATGEFRHRTLAPAVLIAPDRFRLVIARIVAYALTAGIVALVMGAVAFAIGIPLLDGRAGPDLSGRDFVGLAAGGILAAPLSAAIGVGAGTLVRNQVAAVVGLFVWLFILEPLVGLIDDQAVHYTIGMAAAAFGEGGNKDVSMLTSGLVLTAWAVGFSAAGALVDRRRDVE